MTDIALREIRIDGGSQSREKLNQEVIGDYAQLIRAGVSFPAVVLFYDGEHYWLADGFHRYAATAIAVTMDGKIHCEIRQGTRRDAVLFSVGANAIHGLRRTQADKRRAVQTLLNDEEWTTWSDRAIAERCGVSHPLVGEMRKRLGSIEVVNSSTCSNPSELNQRSGLDGKTHPGLKLVTRAAGNSPTQRVPICEYEAVEDSQIEINFELDSNELRIYSPWDSVALTYPQALNLLEYLDSIRHKLKARLAQAC
jgi:hypothetical protein